MGQAKQRGTFEQRRAEAVILNEAYEMHREIKRAEAMRIREQVRLEKLAKMTPEQRTKKRSRSAFGASIIPMVCAMAIASQPRD